MSLGLAFRAFFATLFQKQVAQRVKLALQAPDQQSSALKVDEPAKLSVEPPERKEVPPKRSDALTLISSLQREARLLDLIMEPLDQFEDAQIGAAAREVLRDSRKTLERMFAIAPVANVEEGDSLEIPESPSPSKYRLVGSATARKGLVTHRGWQATKIEIPKWTGMSSEALMLAPIEVETK